MRTFYRQTGEYPEPTNLVGQAFFRASYLSAAGVSMRTPSPVLIASLSVVTGSVTVEAYSLMAMYYGSTVFGSGYVFTPVGIAAWGSTGAGQIALGSQVPLGILALLSVVSLAKSLGGYSGQIGFGPFNSGSTTRFAVYATCANTGSWNMTYASTEQVFVTFLMASAPAYHEYQ